MDEQVTKIKKDLARMQRRSLKLRQEISTKQEELRSICKHEDVKKENSYIEGGYLHRCQFITTYTCEICGVKVGEEIKEGGFC